MTTNFGSNHSTNGMMSYQLFNQINKESTNQNSTFNSDSVVTDILYRVIEENNEREIKMVELQTNVENLKAQIAFLNEKLERMDEVISSLSGNKNSQETMENQLIDMSNEIEVIDLDEMNHGDDLKTNVEKFTKHQSKEIEVIDLDEMNHGDDLKTNDEKIIKRQSKENDVKQERSSLPSNSFSNQQNVLDTQEQLFCQFNLKLEVILNEIKTLRMQSDKNLVTNEVEIQKVEDTEDQVPRKRGRPRKNPLIVENQRPPSKRKIQTPRYLQIDETEDEKPTKRTRGRPRKVMI
ncbi:hypothetical protein BLOT_014083 [Blomia tropicalis]|nr:hypothetical protein BLOT_014083 [Blomia tropicalis]